MKKTICFLSLLSATLQGSESNVSLKEHEVWWENTLEQDTMLETFTSWLGDEDAPSRIAMRRHVLDKRYRSILDIPCGLCIDYYGLKKDGIDIEYLGVDVTPKLVADASQNNIPVILGSIESIPVPDSSFDLVYGRHILEHLADYKQAISEIVRVAKEEALIVFFILPNESSEDKIILPIIDGYPVYHNCYSRSSLEKHLSGYEKIELWTWEKVFEKEEILHIYLKPYSS